MLTDAEKRELIEDARTVEVCLEASAYDYGATTVAKKILLRLADALEESLTDSETEGDEWEYNTRAEMGFLYSVVSLEEAVELVEDSKRLHVYPGSTSTPRVRHVVRRRKAGPWEVVPDV